MLPTLCAGSSSGHGFVSSRASAPRAWQKIFSTRFVIRGKPVTTYWAETKKTDRGGELFLYVNGPVLPFPWIADFFYRRHSGDAQIVIERESS